MPASYSAAFPQSPESGSQQLVRFSFPITWSLLSQGESVPAVEPGPERNRPPSVRTSTDFTREPSAPTLEATLTEPGRALIPAESAEIVAPLRPAKPPEHLASSTSMEPAPRNRSVADQPGPNGAAGDRWEMVIPKMSRPVAWSSKKLISQAPAATPAEVSLPPKEKPPSAGRPTARAEIAAVPRDIALPESSSRGEFRTPEFAAPGFSFSGQEPSRSNRKFVMIGGSSLAALVVVGVVALNLTQDPAGAKGSAPIAREPGAALAVKWTPVSESPRRISVLRDSTSLKDFRMTFQSPVSQKAIGWVFRARDSKNYYAMRLDLPRSVSGSSYAVGTSTGVLKRFAVIDGLDQPATQIPVTIAVQPGATYKIRTEAVGSRFTTWIADRQVDEWAEERLGDGAVGLYNEHGEPPTVVGDLAVSPLVRKR